MFSVAAFFNLGVCARPLAAQKAVEMSRAFRSHPKWRVVDYVPSVANELWKRALALPATLQIYDARLALTLRHHGVTQFATRNMKDFQGFGFKRVWDPLESA